MRSVAGCPRKTGTPGWKLEKKKKRRTPAMIERHPNPNWTQYLVSMPEMVDSRDEFQATLFDEQCFEKIIEKDDDPAAEECKEGREEKGCPHSFAIAQWIEAFRGELTWSCWTVTHSSAYPQHSQIENAVIRTFWLGVKKRNVSSGEARERREEKRSEFFSIFGLKHPSDQSDSHRRSPCRWGNKRSTSIGISLIKIDFI